MLKIRLQRVGRKNDPSFRVVVIDSQKGPKSRNFVEMLGSYNPRQKTTAVNADRVKHWISVGAQTSDTVHNILVSQKVIEGEKINVLPKKSPVIKKEKKTEESAEATDDVSSDTEVKDEKTEEAGESIAETVEKEKEPKTEEAPEKEPTHTSGGDTKKVEKQETSESSGDKKSEEEPKKEP